MHRHEIARLGGELMEDVQVLCYMCHGENGEGGFGPDIVTSDELPPGGAPLRIMTRVNGVTMQDSNTDDLIFDVPTLVHELSKVMTLDPGAESNPLLFPTDAIVAKQRNGPTDSCRLSFIDSFTRFANMARVRADRMED